MTLIDQFSNVLYMYFITVTVSHFLIFYFTVINEETYVYTGYLWHKMHKLFVNRDFYCAKNLERTQQKIVYREWTQHTYTYIVCMTKLPWIISNSFTCKQLDWAKPVVNWYSITLGGHTEGWKVAVIHKQTILMSSENKDVVIASITHSRIKRWQKLWVTCESCKLHPKVWNTSHLQLFTKSTLLLLQDTFKDN